LVRRLRLGNHGNDRVHGSDCQEHLVRLPEQGRDALSQPCDNARHRNSRRPILVNGRSVATIPSSKASCARNARALTFAAETYQLNANPWNVLLQDVHSFGHRRARRQRIVGLTIPRQQARSRPPPSTQNFALGFPRLSCSQRESPRCCCRLGAARPRLPSRGTTTSTDAP